MTTKGVNTATITGRIYSSILKLLKQNPEGLQWSVLLVKVQESDPSFHPKTVNGCVWKLLEKFPEQVYQPSKGRFRLLKYRTLK